MGRCHVPLVLLFIDSFFCCKKSSSISVLLTRFSVAKNSSISVLLTRFLLQKKLVDICFIDSFFCCKKNSSIKLHAISFYIQYQAFEVFALGVIYVYRVVGRLCKLVQYAHIALCHCCCCEHCCTEVLFAYDL